MTGRRKDLDPSSNPRALLGSELRHARERKGISQEALGAPLFVSGSFIGQLEAGTRRMHLEYARHFDEVLGTGGFFARNCQAVAKSKIRITLLRRRRRRPPLRRSSSTRPC